MQGGGSVWWLFGFTLAHMYCYLGIPSLHIISEHYFDIFSLWGEKRGSVEDILIWQRSQQAAYELISSTFNKEGEINERWRGSMIREVRMLLKNLCRNVYIPIFSFSLFLSLSCLSLYLYLSIYQSVKGEEWIAHMFMSLIIYIYIYIN